MARCHRRCAWMPSKRTPNRAVYRSERKSCACDCAASACGILRFRLYCTAVIKAEMGRVPKSLSDLSSIWRRELS